MNALIAFRGKPIRGQTLARRGYALCKLPKLGMRTLPKDLKFEAEYYITDLINEVLLKIFLELHPQLSSLIFPQV